MSLLKVDTPDVEKAIIEYSNEIYPLGNVWVDGKTTTCSVLNRPTTLVNFAKSTAVCTNFYYSYCEYKSKTPP
jgi:hypothetical protein